MDFVFQMDLVFQIKMKNEKKKAKLNFSFQTSSKLSNHFACCLIFQIQYKHGTIIRTGITCKKIPL